MNRKYSKQWPLTVLALSTSLLFGIQITSTGVAQSLDQMRVDSPFVTWQSPARLHRLVGSEKGNFMIGAGGITFQAANHGAETWAFQEIQTFQLSSHGLTIETYQDRKRHMPGVARYGFDFDAAVPSSIAAELAREVQRPSQNAIPDIAFKATDCVAIAAHHHMLRGGSNGELQLCNEGINYVSSAATDSRRWRWADLQTLSDPDPDHLLVFGYRDTYSFDLKETLPSSLFYRMVDALDAHNAGSIQPHNIHPPSVPAGPTSGVVNE